jgi:hypothetical protein
LRFAHKEGSLNTVRWILLLAVCAGCPSTPSGSSPPNQQQRDRDASAYQECSTLCLRPGDCAVAYNDDEICPVGFRCALTFSCTPSPSPSP